MSDSATITVTATSAAVLSELRAVVHYDQGTPAGWLAVELDQTASPVTLSVRANTAPLAPGEFTATVKLAAAGAAPESLTVTTRVVAGAAIGLNSSKICFTTTLGDTTHRDYVRVTSVDGSVIDGLTRTIEHDAGQPRGWLSAELDAGATPTRLRLLGQPAQLPVGTYTATVFVWSPNAGNSPVPIRVTMTIKPDTTRFLMIKLVTIGTGVPGNGRLSAPGINCVLMDGVQTGDCDERYPTGTTVHVSTVPGPGNVFYESPEGPPGRPEFNVILTENSDIQAGFGPPPSTLHVKIRREGNYVGKAIIIDRDGPLRCSDPVYAPAFQTCDAQYAGGTGAITLFSDADYGEQLLGWEGCTTITTGGCVAESTQPGGTTTVTGIFGPLPSQRTLHVTASGPGRVISADQEIDTYALAVCRPTDPQPCKTSGHYYPLTEVVELVATPDANATFVSWSGCPAPSGTLCNVPMTEDRTVVAQFALNSPGSRTSARSR